MARAESRKLMALLIAVLHKFQAVQHACVCVFDRGGSKLLGGGSKRLLVRVLFVLCFVCKTA